MKHAITIKLANNPLRINSRLYGKSHKKQGNKQLVLFIDLSELPPAELIPKQGYLFIYMNDKEVSCKVIYKSNIENPHDYDKGYPIVFEINSSSEEGLKLFGEPQELNYIKKKNEWLFFQYDPLFMEDMPLFQTLDGYVYLMLPNSTMNPVDFSKAYVVIDRT
jgi:hypothetical protein